MLEAVVLAQTYAETTSDVDFARERQFGVAAAGLGFRYGSSLDHVRADAPWTGYDLHFGVEARGLYGKGAGWAFGLGLSAGGVIPQGIDVRVALLPAGFGVALPRMGFVSLIAGIEPAFSSYAPYALLLFPVELRAEIDLGPRARLLVATELDFSPVGRGTVPGTDGFSALLGFRLGRPERESGRQTARGRYVGVQMWEIRGVPYLGFVLGVEAGFGG